MITKVQHLIDALSRFNPDARLTYELDVQGVSPATECSVTTTVGYWSEKMKAAKNKIADLENKIAKLEHELKNQ